MWLGSEYSSRSKIQWLVMLVGCGRGGFVVQGGKLRPREGGVITVLIIICIFFSLSEWLRSWTYPKHLIDSLFIIQIDSFVSRKVVVGKLRGRICRVWFKWMERGGVIIYCCSKIYLIVSYILSKSIIWLIIF